MWYRFATNKEDVAIIQQNLGPSPESFLNNLNEIVDKAQKGFSPQSMSEIRETFQALQKMQTILKKHPDILDRLNRVYPGRFSNLRNLNNLSRYISDLSIQGKYITQGFGASSKVTGKVAEFFQKSLKVLKPLGYAALIFKVSSVLEKYYNGEEVEPKDMASLVASLIQIPQVAAIAGPYAPALMTAGFIADTGGIEAAIHTGKLLSGIGLDKQYQNELEQKTNQASMGNNQRNILSITTQELIKLIKEGLTPEQAHIKVLQKYKTYFDESKKIYQKNKNSTDNLNTASNLTFIPQYYENLRYQIEKYNKKYPKKQPKQNMTFNQQAAPVKPVVQEQFKNNNVTPNPPQYIIN